MPTVILKMTGIPKDDGHLVGLGDGMVVGDNIAARIDDKIGAERENLLRTVADWDGCSKRGRRRNRSNRRRLSPDGGVSG